MADREVIRAVEAAMNEFAEGFKKRYPDRHPSNRLLARIAIDAVNEVYNKRLFERLLGPDKEDEED